MESTAAAPLHRTATQPKSGSAAGLTAEGIEKSFRHGIWPLCHRHQVLRGADLSLLPGEVVGLVGENGPGKSTIMKILVGELAADVGMVTRTGVLGCGPPQPVTYERPILAMSSSSCSPAPTG